MKTNRHSRLATMLLGSAAACALLSAPAFAAEQSANIQHFDIPPQDAAMALNEYARQAGVQIVFPYDYVRGRQTPQVQGDLSRQDALAMLTTGLGLKVTSDKSGMITLRDASDPQSGSAAGDGADGTVQALIVTAQKREEDIQDVPIAISAFTQEDLTRSQVAGGPDLVTQVPNFTFTKTNFSSYSIQIRGIGTQAISATTDPAVAVAFNNTPFIRNRFFEQEFYDLERVEVLRGPQGTLYGRNATAGVVNIISAKPKFRYEAKLSGDLGNFSSSRFEGMVNIPLVEDKVALRIAGAWTKRDGYATNQLNGNPIDGRDLWSTRVSLRVSPNDRFDMNLIWEHFEEDDGRLRSGKQLCDKDIVTEVAGIPTPNYYQTLPETGQSALWAGVQASFSQGCKRTSLYSSDMFQTVNGLMLPYYVPLGGIGLPIPGGGLGTPDPYVSTVQSHDLRVIESTIDPQYQAKADLGELQISFDITDNLTLASETAYSADTVFSLEDFNRFNTASGAWSQPNSFVRPGVLLPGPNGGIFCDPQLGCSDRLVAVDISTADSRQFSQEFRLSSDFDGPFNFSFGGNFLRYDTEDKYYVFINSLSLIAAKGPVFNTYPTYVGGQSANLECMNGPLPGDPNDIYPVTGCIYIDPNPIGSLNDRGHNYFLSRNPYKLISYAAFGEVYYKVSDNLKITGGLRWTVDKKQAPRIPSWVLATASVGYPVAEVIDQEWNEPTGRLAIDWKPDLSFTDETLLYASFAHGYKAGGANPPGFVRVYYADTQAALAQTSATKPKTFDPEFVNAFELGSKNTLLDGRATLNLAGFYYDYTGYQVSEIVDRSAFNRNFDATVWGLEVEADWRPMENLKIGFKGGYERTRIADGERAIDLMDRTAGDPNYILHRPFPTFASSCILPTYMFVGTAGATDQLVNVGGVGGGNPGGCELAYGQGLDPVTRLPYVANPTVGSSALGNSLGYYDLSGPDRYPGFNPFDPYVNNGEGIFKPLGGNELPNAPHYTATVTGDYTLPLPSDWLMILHTDVHWQSQSWWRVFNDNAFDKLHPYFTMNLAAIFTNEEAGWNIMAYIKNVTDETAITGAFLNSDDTGLTTNVFLTEPRLYGLRVTKEWSGGPLLGHFGERRDGPSPFTLELGGQMQRFEADNDHVSPAFMDAFPSAIDPRRLQDKDLGWSGGGDVKLTYAPGGDWRIALGLRYGKTKGSENVLDRQLDMVGCQFGQAAYCDPENPPGPGVDKYLIHAVDWAESRVVEREDYNVADFTIGREVGLGMLTTSTLSGGLRYAQFNSSTIHSLDGTPDWQIPVQYAFYYNEQHHLYHARLDAEREFKGAGPTISWEASRRLFDLGDGGGLDLAWELSGAVLFGKQQTDITGVVTDSYYDDKYADSAFFQTGDLPVSVTPVTIDIHRSQSVTVPTVAASLGLSYSIGGTSIGAGYRWERYFNALDGGYQDHKSYDRAIDGPYFKVSVGFGG